MKQWNKMEQYPTALWDDTDAPKWDEDRVWRQIEAHTKDASGDTTYWWVLSLLLLLFLVTSERPLHVLKAFPVEIPPLTITPAPTHHSDSNLKQEVLPLHLPNETFPKSSSAPPTVSPIPAEETPAHTDSIQHMRRIVPVAFLTPGEIPLLQSKIKILPKSSRPGTKLSMRLPLPDAPLDSATYLKRLWVQLKRFNKQGEVQWEELGIQPNSDGTFSIIPADKRKK